MCYPLKIKTIIIIINWKIVDWDLKNQIKQKSKLIKGNNPNIVFPSELSFLSALRTYL